MYFRHTLKITGREPLMFLKPKTSTWFFCNNYSVDLSKYLRVKCVFSIQIRDDHRKTLFLVQNKSSLYESANAVSGYRRFKWIKSLSIETRNTHRRSCVGPPAIETNSTTIRVLLVRVDCTCSSPTTTFDFCYCVPYRNIRNDVNWLRRSNERPRYFSSRTGPFIFRLEANLTFPVQSRKIVRIFPVVKISTTDMWWRWRS